MASVQKRTKILLTAFSNDCRNANLQCSGATKPLCFVLREQQSLLFFVLREFPKEINLMHFSLVIMKCALDRKDSKNMFCLGFRSMLRSRQKS